MEWASDQKDQAQRRYTDLGFQPDVGPSFSARDQQETVKEQFKGLKHDVVREHEYHFKLRQQLAEAKRELAQRQAEGEAEAAELARLAEEEDVTLNTFDLSMFQQNPDDGESSKETTALGQRSEEDARQAAACLEDGFQEESVKRRRLDNEEYMQLLTWHRENTATRAELERLEAREKTRIEALEELARREVELGLPDLEYDDAIGAIIICDPREGRAGSILSGLSKELRTVQVNYDDDGRLTRAQTHPSLKLDFECQRAVLDDDVAPLLTKVREYLSFQSAGFDTGSLAAAGA